MSAGTPALCRDDTGSWLWPRLRAAFPEAIAALLMPDHPHLVLSTADPPACERRLARLLGHFGRVFGVGGQASRVAPAVVIRAGVVLARQVRYVALNPCREGLARCPLAWRWSTHRDVVGAIADPWVTAARLAVALEMPVRGFAERHHAYVSADPHASVDGTRFPVPARSTSISSVPLRTIADAVAAATRQPVAALRGRGPMRSLFIALAFDQGWAQPAMLAELCDVQTRAVHRLAKRVDEHALRAARLCLADARLVVRPRPPRDR